MIFVVHKTTSNVKGLFRSSLSTALPLIDSFLFPCSESSLDSLTVGEILGQQKLDLEGVEIDDLFHERSDTHSEAAKRTG